MIRAKRRLSAWGSWLMPPRFNPVGSLMIFAFSEGLPSRTRLSLTLRSFGTESVRSWSSYDGRRHAHRSS